MPASPPNAGGASPLPRDHKPTPAPGPPEVVYGSASPAADSYYGRLLALSSGQEDHFFANLHGVIAAFMDAPILIAATGTGPPRTDTGCNINATSMSETRCP